MEKSGVDLRYTDSKTGEKFVPHVIEPTFGLSRTMLVLLTDAYHEEEGEKSRTVLKLDPKIAPYKVAVFPLLANKPELKQKAKAVFDDLSSRMAVNWDERGNIGKRYFSQDEIGTPFCVTVDFDSLKDKAVTVRDRDSALQERVSLDKLKEYLKNKLEK
jgi:glycyl-tRNA synthetase